MQDSTRWKTTQFHDSSLYCASFSVRLLLKTEHAQLDVMPSSTWIRQLKERSMNAYKLWTI